MREQSTCGIWLCLEAKPNFPYSDNLRGFGYMVGSSIPEPKACYSAIKPGEYPCGEKSNLSTSAVCRVTDIIAIKGNPLEDVRPTQHASFLVKHGRIFKSP
jgi:hypothetical protein